MFKKIYILELLKSKKRNENFRNAVFLILHNHLNPSKLFCNFVAFLG